MPHLFDPVVFRSLTLRNRVVMSPMCQYSASEDGEVTDWHLVHYGARAVGGVGAIIVEMTQVAPEGRLSPRDLGIWSDRHVPGLRRLAEFVHGQGCPIGVQLGHAGRKADPAFEAVGASPIAFSDHYRVPRELDAAGVARLRDAFALGARRAMAAGVDLVELHGAHVYILNQFLSPLSNHRLDGYGGDLQGRARLLLEVAEAVRSVVPEDKPLFCRLSMTEAGAPGGYPLEDTLWAAERLHELGCDLIDCSTGGNAETSEEESPGFRLPISSAVERRGVPAMPVGLLDHPALADAAIAAGLCTCVGIARGLLRDPSWALHAQQVLGREPSPPWQYARAYLR